MTAVHARCLTARRGCAPCASWRVRRNAAVGGGQQVRRRVDRHWPACLWAVLVAVLWRGLGNLRVPVAAYSLLLAAMAVLAAGRNAAAGGPLFAVSDALIACGLAGVSAVPRQEPGVMPAYAAAQFLLAAGFLRPRRGRG